MKTGIIEYCNTLKSCFHCSFCQLNVRSNLGKFFYTDLITNFLKFDVYSMHFTAANLMKLLVSKSFIYLNNQCVCTLIILNVFS